MAYVPVPKDLSKVKTKVAFNLTKRQIVCFAAALLFGLPLFFLLKDSTGTSLASMAKAREITFSDLTLEEARQLHTFDEYFKGEIAFERAGKKITPKLLLEAIRTLPEEKRKAVLLYYFEGMNDTEIAELFDTSRSTIQYRRTSSFELLKKYLEENADEWDEW